MIKQKKYSIRLHWLTILCFLLPFFYTGCEPDEKDKPKELVEDSVSVAPNKIKEDSLKHKRDSVMASSTVVSAKDTKSQSKKSTDKREEKEKEIFSPRIAKKYPILAPILVPKEDTYTGLGTVINSFIFVTYMGTFISFLLLIICLIVKWIEWKAKKVIMLLNILALIFHLISKPYSFDSERLYGFWVAFIFIFALTIYDLYTTKLDVNKTQPS